MDLFEAIAARHSYRGPFVQRPVPRADLERMVQAGLQAPSGYNGQSTSFVIVDDPDLIASIARIVPNDVVKGAPALIVCVMDPRAGAGRELAFGVEDCAAATENILLAATALGYASVWLDGTLRSEARAERIAKLLGVPADLRVAVLLPVGAPQEARRQREKKPFAERASWNGYRRAP